MAGAGGAYAGGRAFDPPRRALRPALTVARHARKAYEGALPSLLPTGRRTTMVRGDRTLTVALLVLTLVVGSTMARPAAAASAAELNRDGAAALRKLYAVQPTAKMLGQRAR